MKKLLLIVTVVLLALVYTSCKYDFIVPEEVINPDDPDVEQVSFSEDIIPIFTGNNCTACHDTGGQIPDLTPDNAFSALNTSRYINTSAPEESLIYTRPHPDGSGSHPTYSEADAALILVWLKQGAENN